MNTAESARQLSTASMTHGTEDKAREVVRLVFANDRAHKCTENDAVLAAVKEARGLWSGNVKFVPWAVRYAYELGFACELHDNMYFIHREMNAYPKDSEFRGHVAMVLDGLVQPWTPWLSMHASKVAGVKKTLDLQAALNGIATAIAEHLQSSRTRLKKFFTGERKRAYKHYEQKMLKRRSRLYASVPISPAGDARAVQQLLPRARQHPNLAQTPGAPQLIAMPSQQLAAQTATLDNTWRSFQEPQQQQQSGTSAELKHDYQQYVRQQHEHPQTSSRHNVLARSKSSAWLVVGITVCVVVLFVVGVLIAVNVSKHNARRKACALKSGGLWSDSQHIARLSSGPPRVIRVNYSGSPASPFTPGLLTRMPAQYMNVRPW